VAGILSTANGLLGYAGDARLLIVNADDFGMSAAVNQGVLGAIRHGVAQAASLMVPWPGAAPAMAMLRENPDVSFGLRSSRSAGMESPLAKRVPAPRQGHEGAPPAWPDHRTGPDQ
jgi:predicted glycoside hydrolase/deacetylase ChbG (UPF0249 family)